MILKSACATLIGFCIVVLSVSQSRADQQMDAYVTVEKWAEASNAADIEKIVAVYNLDALLLGTVSPSLTSKSDDLRAYFARAFAAKTQVKLGEFSGTALADGVVAFSGFYEFSRPGTDGQFTGAPARYSLVLVKKGAEWKIANHHSSPRPKPAQ